MVEESAFRGVVGLLAKIGVYDIILPFLLVFTIVFAILEKTKILGVEKIDGNTIPKKNLNSMTAIIIAFLVIASTKLVAVINEVMANVVLLVILSVCFLMLVGSFFGDKEFSLSDYKGWVQFFMIFMFIGIVTIFLNALGWLKYIAGVFVYWEAEWAATLIFVAIIIGFIIFITRDGSPKKEKSKD